mgnify:CR=1 FL=1
MVVRQCIGEILASIDELVFLFHLLQREYKQSKAENITIT